MPWTSTWPREGAELRVVGRWLRLIDPATGEPVPVPQEEHEARLAAQDQARQLERALREAQAELKRLRGEAP